MCEYDTTTAVRQWLYTAPKFICLMTTVLLVVLFSTLLTRDPIVDNQATNLLANVLQDTNNQAINAITLPTDNVCPTGYEIITLTRWEGTVEGCIDPLGYVDRGRCTQRVKTYTTVPAVKAKNFNVWRGNSFCVKKTKTLMTLSNGNQCPGSLVACSNDTCIDPSEVCPVINLQIVDNNTNISSGYHYHSIQLNTTNKLVYQHSSANNSGDFISRLNISFFGLPCVNPEQNPEPKKGGYPYLLSPSHNIGCGRFGIFESFNDLDHMSLYKVFDENGVDESTRKNLPEFDDYISGETAYFLGIKRYAILNNVQCGVLGPDIITKLAAYELDFTDSLWAVTITLILITLTLCVTIPFESMLRHRDYEEEKIMLRLVAYLNIGLLGFMFFLYMVKGLLTFNARKDIDPEYAYLKKLANNECFVQPEINLVLQQFISEMAMDLYVIFALNITLAGLATLGFIMLVLLTLADIVQVRKNKQSQFAYSNRNIRKKNNKENNDNIELLLKNQH